ncbi:MAG: DUF3883 domain-containing protein [Geminicoccaceae bacterium]|nr:DUF3883 domain-containing protein [Geminicoccaceae bacterium]
MANSSWSDAENDLIVADYFDMLKDEINGEKPNKAERNRALREHLDDRSKGSVEFKHQNISAVMLGFGQPWIDGYKPAPKIQIALIDAVRRWLDAHPDWLTERAGLDSSNALTGVSEFGTLFIGPPPTFSNQPPPIDSDKFKAVARHFDAAERDDRNRKLGAAGERHILEHERTTLRDAGRADLARKIRWTSKEDGDGAGYDIASFEPDGRERLIEVKTTNGWERTPFYITPNELQVAERNEDCWHLVRLWDFARTPRAFAIRPPLERHISLIATAYRATLLGDGADTL